MSVRAKFTCHTVAHYAYGRKKVSLTPVTAIPPTEENKAFWKATPSGQIEMTIDNPDAAMQFEPGKAYYVDFTPAE